MNKMLKRVDQNSQTHIRLYISLTMYILLSPTVEGINQATFYIYILICSTFDVPPDFNVGVKYVRSVISHRYGITPKNEIVGGGG